MRAGLRRGYSKNGAENAGYRLLRNVKVRAEIEKRNPTLDEIKHLAESESAKQLRAKLVELKKQPLGMYIWKTYLEESYPKFLYFDEYYQMEGELNIQKLKERQANKKLEDSE